jgi:23S rRNA pseudouridine2605 synthase
MATDRLQKILARAGIASRRAAEELVVAGRVRVNGRVVRELGTKADPRADKVEVDGKRVILELPLYVVFHKPRGVVSTLSDPEGRPTVKTLLADIPARVYPVGRLDFATSGVLLATNDGDFADGLLHPRRAVPKTYVLKVKGLMKPKDLDRWADGVRLEDGMTAPAKVKLLRHEEDKTWFELTITEGRNQQIRRMGDATGFRVMRLARVSFAGVTAEGLRPGEWRLLTRDELQDLKKEYGVPKRMPPMRSDTPKHGGEPAPGGWGLSRGSEERDGGGPRYGGGSPGRRAYDVHEDWGGGAGRGRTGSDRDRPPREDVGGRGGRSRTTGTGGGIGGHGDERSYRVKTRRG